MIPRCETWYDVAMKTQLGEELRRDLQEGYWHGWSDENPLEHVLPVGYDGEITDDVHNILRLLREERAIWYADIAERLKIDKKYVHLILEMLGGKDFTEYGTSPRGSWLTEKGEQLLDLTDEWKALAAAITHPLPVDPPAEAAPTS
jgi:DNA-binding MarR family transcriptional regulator